MAKQYSPQEALHRLASRCALSEYAPFDARVRLERWGIAPMEAEKIIAHLIAEKYIDEGRFVRSFIHDKITFSRWGKIKVLHALKAKGIALQLVEEVWNEIDSSLDEENLQHLLTRKSATISHSDAYKRKGQLYRYALARGYTTEQIRKALNDTEGGLNV